MNVKLNLKGLIQIVEELKSKIVTNFITNITVINSSDIIFSFSFYKKERLLISLNHNSPFISLIQSEQNYKTTMGSLNESLRKHIKGAYIIDVELLNNDRVVKFKLSKTNEFYQKENLSLVLELIPTINNLIILDTNGVIKYAKHYSDLTASRPILKGIKYTEIENNNSLKITDFDMENFHHQVHSYLIELDEKTKKEKAEPLYRHLTQKKKSLEKKILVLENEMKDAKEKLSYKEVGDTLLTLKDDKDNLETYIKEIESTYDTTLSVQENISKYYERYKKSKRTIENDLREIEIARQYVDTISQILNIFGYLTEEELNELYLKYLPNSIKDKRKILPSNLPYFVKVDNFVIGFGKNAEQNNYLTFKLARKDCYYLHVKDHSGSHVVIFSNNPSKEAILVASEIALILSKLDNGDIYLADVKDVKKGERLGEVNILKYETITLHSIRDKTKELLKTQERFKKID